MGKKDSKILITGGHLTPAWITAKELQDNGYTNLLWVGRKYTQKRDKATSPEYQLVSELKIPFIHFRTGKLWRRWNKFTYFSAIVDLLLIPYGFLYAIYIILRFKPKVIVSFGGYVALPIVIAGKILMRKIITHEQVIQPGLANRVISKFADKILISWEDSEQFFPKSKTILTGNPSWVSYHKQSDVEEKYEFDNDLPVISFLGGNQGSHTINSAIFANLNSLLRVANVIHQTGRSEVTGDKYKAAEYKGNLSKTLSSRYYYSPYLFEEIYEVFDKSELLVARGGANTMTDIILKAQKSIIIPIPWSSGKEQLKNAKYLEKLGLASIIEYENEINPEEFLKEIKKRLKDEVDKKGLRKIQALIRYAQVKIVKEIISVL